MTPMAAECGYDKCSFYRIRYLETTSVGMNIIQQIVLNLIYIYFGIKIRILTPKTVDKWPPWDYFEMLALEYGLSSKLRLSIDWPEFRINF